MGDQSSADLISLPQGGGAVHGIGETFQPDLHTGTGNYTVPLELPPGRVGLTPKLALAYSSGNGNGQFGLGWQLSVPGVRRKTDKRIPRYEGDDVFVLSGAEDLVPVPGSSDPTVQRYRPQTETLFARIEHHAGGTDHWQVWSKDGLRSTYGTPRPASADSSWRDPAVIADPDSHAHILGWLLTSTVDTLGNSIAYTYKPDPNDLTGPQRYLAQIGYVDYGDPTNASYLVEVRFIYQPRPDRHTDRRGGFAIRTAQRCATIETWTSTSTPQLARTVAFSYGDADTRTGDNGVSLLTTITVTGHDGQATQSLPPLEFGYSKWEPAKRRYQPIDTTAGAAPEHSLADKDLDLVDLFGDGLPDVLQLAGGVARYWRNRGGGKLDVPRSLAAVPAGVSLGGAGVQLCDADGDGRPDLLVTTGARAGYFPIGTDGGFDPRGYVPYPTAPAFGLTDPNTRLIDVDGDGIADALRIGTVLELYLNRCSNGWIAQPADRGSPLNAVSFADPRIKLADMTGDGLTDVVQVGNGRLQYWPNLGYGQFGQPVVMTNSPRFEDANLYGTTGFDPARLLLGDVDGDGLADVVYVGPGSTMVWVNQGGEGFAAAQSGAASMPTVVVPATPRVDNLTALRLADLLGSGTSGVLWTFDTRPQGDSAYKFLDLTGGTKPYLLTGIDNHSGACTAVTYASSTRYALADAAAGKPWQTTLPFPVHVVASVQVVDYFSGTTLTSEYDYHHGYWDGASREYRGFARVDQRDALIGQAGPYYSPPTETRTWFHLGPVGPEFGAWRELDLSNEYWSGDKVLLPHVDASALNTPGIPRRALRDAIRAARGQVLRTERYGLDSSPMADRPYEIADHACELAPIFDGRSAADPSWRAAPVVAVYPILDRTSTWERGTDPMTRATSTGGYDDYGRAHQTVAIAVPRGRDPHIAGPPRVAPFLATTTLTDYATRDDTTHYLADRVSAQQRLELTEDTSSGGNKLVAFAAAQLASPPTATAASIRALTLTHYDGPPFVGLPSGQLGDWGLRTRVERLVLTPEILRAAYQGGDATIPLPPYLVSATPTWSAEYPLAFRDLMGTTPTAGYEYLGFGPGHLEGWYIQEARVCYDVQQSGVTSPPLPLPPPSPKGLQIAIQDPLGKQTTITYDAYQLLPASVTNPAGLTRTATYDYRVLLPSVVADVNGNQSAVGYTPLGLPAWIAATGKPGTRQGDTPLQPGTFFSYNLTAWDESPLEARAPLSVYTTRRVDHRWTLVDQANAERAVRGLPPLTDAEIATMFPANEVDIYPGRFVHKREFSDGFGRLLQTRAQGDNIILDDLGLTTDLTIPPSPVVTHVQDPAAPAQVVVSSWQTYDNKGRVVETYEPQFDSGWTYQQLTAGLAKVITVYDPRGLAVRTIRPDRSELRVIPGIPPDLTNPDSYVPTPWESYHYDSNDNGGRTDPAGSSPWSSHWNTPSSDLVDAMGRVIRHADRTASTTVIMENVYDIDGNVLQVIDPLSRVAAHHIYDLARRSWREEYLDAGVVRLVLDAGSGAVERRDDKGALELAVADSLRRPSRRWARDRPTDTPTLREVVIYGDQTDSGLSTPAAAAANLLGHPYRSYDEAGAVETPSYDLDGNLVEKTRRVLCTSVLLSGLPASGGDWSRTAYQVNWQPGPGQTLDQLAQRLLDPTGYTISSAYDALRRPAAITAPLDAEAHRKTLHMRYSAAGTLTALDVDSTPYVNRILYNAHGRRVLAELGCATMSRYVYDPKTFRLARLRSEPSGLTTSPSTDPAVASSGRPDPRPGGPRPASLQDYGYSYDLVGNLLWLRDRTPGSGVSPKPDQLDRAFTYDPLYRLTSAGGRECDLPPNDPWSPAPRCADLTKSRAYREAYTYDDVGSLLMLAHRAGAAGSVRTYTVAPGSNRLSAVDVANLTYAYSYDSCGNMLSETTSRHFEWDHTNRMATFRTQATGADPSVYAQYRYDASGRRVLKVVRNQGGQLAVTVYVDGLFERLTLTDRTGISAHDALHILDGSTRVAVARVGSPVPDDPSPPIAYHLGDHLGSCTVILDASGTFFNREEYTPYGETSFGSYAKKRYRYTAKERDEESGLYYHGARYNAPWLARWTSCDPTGPRDGTNLYRYVRNDPLAFVDPSGTYAEAGHGKTTYFIALAAGWPKDKARSESFWAQAPDEIKELDAKEAGMSFFTALLTYNPLRAVGAIIVQVGGHALTGGPADQERRYRASALARTEPGTPESGAATHAFEDSYPHTEIDGNKEYIGPLGHSVEALNLRDPHLPDQIADRPVLYANMAVSLYITYKGMAAARGWQPRIPIAEVLKVLNAVGREKTKEEQKAILDKASVDLLRQSGEFDPKFLPPNFAGHEVEAFDTFQRRYLDLTQGVTIERLLKNDASYVGPRGVAPATSGVIQPLR